MVERIPDWVTLISRSQIAAGKLSFKSTLNQSGTGTAPLVVEFSAVAVKQPKKKQPDKFLVCAAE